MELFKNAAGYAPLVTNLEGHWETSFDDLPDQLKPLVKRAFFGPPWDCLDVLNRRSISAQHDYQHDPNHEPATYFELAAFSEELNDWIVTAREESKDAAVVVLREVADRVEKILDSDRERVGAEIQKLREGQTLKGKSSTRETTYLNMIGALLECILGQMPGAEKHQSFDSEAKLIEMISEKYNGIDGLSKRNLEKYFAEAKRNLNAG